MVNGELLVEFGFGLAGLIGGSIVTLLTQRILHKQREFHATQRDQIENIYAPLEMLLKINQFGFDWYFKPNTKKSDKKYIERHIWHPNHLEIKKIIMKHTHLLEELPPLLQKLLIHINVWLSEYELIYNLEESDRPVFGGPKGYPYPKEVDQFVYDQAAKLRKKLNRKPIWEF